MKHQECTNFIKQACFCINNPQVELGVRVVDDDDQIGLDQQYHTDQDRNFWKPPATSKVYHLYQIGMLLHQ